MSKAKHEPKKKVKKLKGPRMSVMGRSNAKPYGLLSKRAYETVDQLIAAARAELSKKNVHEVVLGR